MRRRSRGEGSIRERPDGRWEARVWVELPTGARQRRSIFGATLRDVQAQLLAARQRQAQGLAAAPEAVTVGAFLAAWLADVVRPRVRASTLQSYQDLVRCHLAPHLGALRLTRLGPHHVEAMLARMEEAGLSPRRRAYAVAVLRTALRTAERRGLAHRNAAQLVALPRSPHRELQPLAPEHARAFLGAVAGQPWEALFLIALSAGLRQGELLGLRWSDLDLEAGTLRVRQAVARIRVQESPPRWELQISEVKSATSRRTMSIGGLTIAALRAHRARQAEARLRAGREWQELDLVFPAADGGPLDNRRVYTAFRAAMAALEAAGVPRQRFHDLRHACASLLLLQGAGLVEVKEQLGHSTITLTANTYAHVYERAQKALAARMDEVLGGTSVAPPAPKR